MLCFQVGIAIRKLGRVGLIDIWVEFIDSWPTYTHGVAHAKCAVLLSFGSKRDGWYEVAIVKREFTPFSLQIAWFLPGMFIAKALLQAQPSPLSLPFGIQGGYVLRLSVVHGSRLLFHETAIQKAHFGSLTLSTVEGELHTGVELLMPGKRNGKVGG